MRQKCILTCITLLANHIANCFEQKVLVELNIIQCKDFFTTAYEIKTRNLSFQIILTAVSGFTHFT